ncbi:MAG TPA: VCBS repeat-containing protein, partial [Pyrinomonadaceae bacterium]
MLHQISARTGSIARALRAFALCLSLALPVALSAQTPPQPPPPQGMGGNATGEARTYATKRTVNVTDAKAAVVFEDVTAKTALAAFRHRAGSAAKDYILDTPSGGVAVFDYDSDGRPDIYLLNGSTFAALAGKERAPRAALYRNLGNWKFEDVTDKAGVANERWGMGVAVGDYDNDGRPDIYLLNGSTFAALRGQEKPPRAAL